MNITYLMQYVSRRLHTIVRKFSVPDGSREKVCERADLTENASFADEEDVYAEKLLTFAEPDCPPLIATGEAGVSYGIVHSGESVFIVGPVILAPGSESRHKLPPLVAAASLIPFLYHCKAADMISELLLIQNLFRENICSMHETADYNFLDRSVTMEVNREFTDIVFQHQEEVSTHNPYDQEVREVDSIRNGDLEQLKRSWAEDYIGELGIVADDPLRNCQNLGIVLVTLASRAAIEGGLLPETAFSLSDSYIRKLEKARAPETAYQLGRQAEYHYALLVKEEKEKKAGGEKAFVTDSRVSQCKDYIFAHLHGRITTAQIAKALYINPNYLSGLFKKEEGITIGQYILQEKIKLVKNMLIYSRYSYIEIANYMGFCSQSHLGEKFKKATGLTLHQYREKYGVKGFLGK